MRLKKPVSDAAWSWDKWKTDQTLADPFKKPFEPEQVGVYLRRGHALGFSDVGMGLALAIPHGIILHTRANTHLADPILDKIITLKDCLDNIRVQTLDMIESGIL